MALVLQHPSIANPSGKGKIEMPLAHKFLEHVSYDPNNLQMTVTMKNGSQYLYFMVYPTVMDQWMQARSKGEFFSRFVKGQHQSSRTISKATGEKISKQSKIQGRPHG